METIWLDRAVARILGPLIVLAGAGMMAAAWCTFFYAVPERTMGISQLTFYLHVPAAFVTYILYAAMFLGSFLYLWSGKMVWDTLAKAGGEVGLAFACLMIFTGPLWAKPVWGHYWTWDPRLTSAFVLWLIYAVYALLRMIVDRPDKQAKFAAVLAILGAADIPIIHYSVKWWNAQHPGPVVFQKKVGGGLTDSTMRITLLVAFLANLALGLTFLFMRYRQLRLAARVEALDSAIERSRMQTQASSR